MDLETFQSLPTEKIAQIVREAGPKVCVFPVNGTRRWFTLEHQAEAGENYIEVFLRKMVEMHIALYALCFDHGIDTLLTPIFGLDILERPDADTATRGMELLAGPRFLDFYQAYGIRTRFYGDYRKVLASTPYAHIPDLFDSVTAQTLKHEQRRLFIGVCAHDATESVAEIGVRFYKEHNHRPDKRQIVEAYYGEYIQPVNLFIGFGPFAAFDMPLLATGSEDLYFTVSPSPYLDALTLRAILYDHLYTRPGEPDYEKMTATDWDALRLYYQANQGTVLGTGMQVTRGGIWCPIGKIQLPDNLLSPKTL